MDLFLADKMKMINERQISKIKKMRKKYWAGWMMLGGVILVLALLAQKNESKNSDEEADLVIPSIKPTEIISKNYPIAQFRERVTKKPFGIYIIPNESPVQPEKFSGFHTGVDVEYEDVEADVPVWAVCDGEMVLSRWVSGYGGTAVIKCRIENDDYYVLYGHLKVNSINKNLKIYKGDQIGILGKGKTEETDYERKHLHLSIHKDTMEMKGYVQNESELNNWVNPLETNIFD